MMPISDRAGLKIAWRRIGAGARPALFCHCTLASSRALVPLMEALSDTSAMIAFDLPGHGESADWAGSGDYLDRCADVAGSFVDAPMDLVGHSFGAVVALALMARCPDLVRRAVLIEPVFFAAAADTAAFDRHAAEYSQVRDALEAGDREAATARFTEIWGTGGRWSDLPAAQRRAMTSRVHLVAAAGPGLSEDSTNILAEGRLERIEAPVLLARGSDCHPVIPPILEALARRLPAAETEIVRGAGHMAPITHPAQTAAIVRRHLGGGIS